MQAIIDRNRNGYVLSTQRDYAIYDVDSKSFVIDTSQSMSYIPTDDGDLARPIIAPQFINIIASLMTSATPFGLFDYNVVIYSRFKMWTYHYHYDELKPPTLTCVDAVPKHLLPSFGTDQLSYGFGDDYSYVRSDDKILFYMHHFNPFVNDGSDGFQTDVHVMMTIDSDYVITDASKNKRTMCLIMYHKQTNVPYFGDVVFEIDNDSGSDYRELWYECPPGKYCTYEGRPYRVDGSFDDDDLKRVKIKMTMWY